LAKKQNPRLLHEQPRIIAKIVDLLSLRLISRVRQPFLQSQRAREQLAGYQGPACDS
jgi:hypothetical protein